MNKINGKLYTLETSDGVRSLKEMIERCLTSAKQWFEDAEPNEDFSKVKAKLTDDLRSLSSLSSREDLLFPIDEMLLPMKDKSSQAHYRVYELTWAVRAEISLERGDTDAAWFFLTEARFGAGLAEGLYYVESNTSMKRSRASKGGTQRDKEAGFDRAREECVRLISELDLGNKRWTHSAVADAIAPKLETFIKSNSIVLGGTALASTVTRWISSNEDVKQAYKRFKTQSKRPV